MAGFECEFVEQPPQIIQTECPICLLVLREPYQATCCGKSYCKECIEQIKASTQDCPTCNVRNIFSYPNLGLQQSLYDFHVYCTHKSKGCEWTGELRELDNHLNSDPPADKSLEGCPFTDINCPLNCVGCETRLPRKALKIHLSDKLLSLVVIQTVRVTALEQENHSLQARLQVVEGDKQYLEQRTAELEVKVSELEGEVKQLAMKQSVLAYPGKSNLATSQPSLAQHDAYLTGTNKPIGGMFTMTDFEEYKKDNEEWLSPPFYTHPHGYKMCLRIDVNGDSSGKGTHVSLHVYLMRGEFDDQLKWPFQGSITIKLLNQEEDKEHIVKTIYYDGTASAESSNRVVGREWATSARGLSTFIEHTDLEPKYLKNDCIKLCVKRVVLTKA